jgi:hypothetical protein
VESPIRLVVPQILESIGVLAHVELVKYQIIGSRASVSAQSSATGALWGK